MSPKLRGIVCLGLSVVVGGAVWIYLRRAEQKIQSLYKMTTVLCARKYVASGKVVSEDILESVPVPVAFLQPTAVQKKEDLLDKDGKPCYQTRIGLLKGEQITKSRLVLAGVFSGLSWILPDGVTAQTLKLSAEQAVGGLVQPGDWVNLICVIDKQPGWGKLQALTLLERVRVLAVNQSLWDPALAAGEKGYSKTEGGESFLVTVEVAPTDASLVALASEKGRIILTLVSPVDRCKYAPPPVGLSDLKGDHGPSG